MFVLVRFYCWDKHHCQKATRGGKGLCCFQFHSTVYYLEKSGQELRAGTWKQELMQRPWRGAAYWLVPHGMINLCSYRTQDHQPRDGPSHNGLSSFVPSINQENVAGFCRNMTHAAPQGGQGDCNPRMHA